MNRDAVVSDRVRSSSGTPAASGLEGKQGLRISIRLALIIAGCLLPVIALQVAVSWLQWSERKAQTGALAVHQAELLAGDVESIVEGARILLGAAAAFNQVQTLGESCSTRLAALRNNASGFALLALVDPMGEVRCASDPALVGTRAEWARWGDGPRGGVATGRFTRLPGWPGGVLPFLRPLDESGPESAHTLVAALDLGWLERHLIRLKRAGSPFMANGILTIADADGVILARDARHAEFVGRSFPPEAMGFLQATQSGILRLRSIDGTERVVGYTPPTRASHQLAALAGFYEPELMADIEGVLLRGVLLLAAVSAAAFALTMLVARRFISQPTKALLDTARSWRDGDLAARAPETGGATEFGQLAAAYNRMAAALQRRERDLRCYAEAQEARVEERTRELTLANQKLQQEIAERRNTEAALLQAQKVQAVGQLAGGIAHDFNNVLQAVLGGASQIRRRASDVAAVTRVAGMVEEAARRGQSITRRLLAFSRREELRAESLDLAELLGNLQQVLGATLGARYRVQTSAAPGLPPVLADQGQLETVLVNLATNARDAMPHGGTLTLSAALERIAEGDPCLAAGDYIRLVAADTGAGMSPETLARAAEPFFTTKPLGQGTGLGLAMARSFAEGSGGRLSIASEPGRGTCVSLWLRVAVTGAGGDAAGPERQRPRSASHAPRRVLLVDDDEVVRHVLARELTDEGCTVIDAASGLAALAELDRGVAVDILASDLAMPGMDGVALIREAQRRRPDLPAILITGYAGDAAALAMGQTVAGAFTLVRKPVTGAQLADQVESLLHAAAAGHRPTAAGPAQDG